jgi:hypothetical protein
MKNLSFKFFLLDQCRFGFYMQELSLSADAGNLRGFARVHKLGNLVSSRACPTPHSTSSPPIFKHFFYLIFGCVLCVCRGGAADAATPLAGQEGEGGRVG